MIGIRGEEKGDDKAEDGRDKGCKVGSIARDRWRRYL